MKAFSIVFLFVFVLALQGSQNLARARQLAESGDGPGARALLAHAAQSAPDNIAALTEYADFLDCHADPAAIEAYSKLLVLFVFVLALQGSQNLERARQLAESGDGPGARALLAPAAQSAPDNIAALTEYADFLDCHADPAAIEEVRVFG